MIRKPRTENKWYLKQDERENILRRSYPKIFHQICDSFYKWRNQNPLNTPNACLTEVLKTVKIRKQTKADFERVFVVDFEKGSN